MIFAAMGALNSTFSSFQAVLQGLQEMGIQIIVQTGNIIYHAEEAGAAIDTMKRFDVRCVQGEHDRMTVEYLRKPGIRRRISEEKAQAIARAHASLSPASVEWIHALPRSQRIEVDGLALFLCHGTPLSQRETLSPDTPTVRFQRLREAAAADIIVFSAQASFTRIVDGALFAGVGPIAPGGGMLQYTLINTEESPWRAESHGIPSP